jgi:hypothetical protein
LDAVILASTDAGGAIGMPALALVATAVLAYRQRSWTAAIFIVTAAAGPLLIKALLEHQRNL